jgi:TonB-dependent starch-binding outer membrane protein SusC
LYHEIVNYISTKPKSMQRILRLVFFLLVCSGATELWAQERVVTGKVTSSDDGIALPGVNVIVKGTTTGTVTDIDGTYSIKVLSNETILAFTFVGFATQEVKVGALAKVDVTLVSDARQLAEVVVIGYGSQIKQELTGNIASVKGSDIKNIPVPNMTQALQGRAAGVFVEGNSGRVGEGIKVRVRGASSLSASNEPLYVVDGIPINNSTLSSAQTGTAVNNGSALASINFNDIESFEILKDASAAAIYGSRASNGVVLITTKRGKQGKTSFTLDTQYGFSKPTNFREFLNAQEYVEFYREAARNTAIYEFNRAVPANPGGYATEQDAIDDYVAGIEGLFDTFAGHTNWRTGEVDTNWEKEAFKSNPIIKTVNLSASGGNEKTKFFISGEYTDQDGILLNNAFQRLSSRVNLDQTVNERFKMGFSLGLSKTTTDRTTQDNDFGTPLQAVALAPITPVRDPKGNLYDIPVTTYYNPLINAENAQYQSIIFRNIGSVYGEYRFLKSLSFRSELGIDILDQNDEQFFGSKTQSAATNGFAQSDWLRSVNYNTNNYFTHTFEKEDHSLISTVGMSFQRTDQNQTNVLGEQFPTDDLKKLASAGLITGGFSNGTQFSFLSYFARANYSYKGKYLLSINGRVDGSSRFGINERYGFFPSASAGWILSNESFLSENKILSFLKLRASYGVVGNSEVGNFNQFGLWQAQSPYNGTSTLTPTQVPNPDLTWELTKQVDIGIDFGLFNNRITGELDYYKKNTEDLLFNTPVPGTSGFRTVLKNIGEMQNEGFEIVLNSTNIDRGGFRWTTSLNLAKNRNKILKLDGLQQNIPGNNGRYLNSLLVGESLGIFYGPKYAGVDPQNGDPLFFRQDGETTTNRYTEAGNFIVGDPNPDWVGGITNTISFKGFDVSVLLQVVYGNDIINGAGGFMSANGDFFDNQTKDQLRRWQKPGDITDVPQARLNVFETNLDNGVRASSRYVYDGSYLRVKNLSVGYSFPNKILTRLKLNSARLYVTGVNLFTFTNYPGWDPEVNADFRAEAAQNGNRNQGNDFYSAPQIKSVIFGINLGF